MFAVPFWVWIIAFFFFPPEIIFFYFVTCSQQPQAEYPMNNYRNFCWDVNLWLYEILRHKCSSEFTHLILNLQCIFGIPSNKPNWSEWRKVGHCAGTKPFRVSVGWGSCLMLAQAKSLCFICSSVSVDTRQPIYCEPVLLKILDSRQCFDVS